jgi:hypothetical protein
MGLTNRKVTITAPSRADQIYARARPADIRVVVGVGCGTVLCFQRAQEDKQQ